MKRCLSCHRAVDDTSGIVDHERCPWCSGELEVDLAGPQTIADAVQVLWSVDPESPYDGLRAERDMRDLCPGLSDEAEKVRSAGDSGALELLRESKADEARRALIERAGWGAADAVGLVAAYLTLVTSVGGGCAEGAGAEVDAGPSLEDSAPAEPAPAEPGALPQGPVGDAEGDVRELRDPKPRRPAKLWVACAAAVVLVVSLIIGFGLKPEPKSEPKPEITTPLLPGEVLRQKQSRTVAQESVKASGENSDATGKKDEGLGNSDPKISYPSVDTVSASDDSWTGYKNADFNIGLAIPEGFRQVDPKEGESFVFGFTNADETADTYVYLEDGVTKREGITDMETWVEACESEVKKDFEEFVVETNGVDKDDAEINIYDLDFSLGNKINGKTIHTSVAANDKTLYLNETLFLNDDGDGMTIVCSAFNKADITSMEASMVVVS